MSRAADSSEKPGKQSGATVQFFFGVDSRYSYLASTRVPKLAAETGARFIWRALYSDDLIERAGPDPFRAEVRRGQYDPAYRTRDAIRWARHLDVPYRDPPWDSVEWIDLVLACLAAELRGVGEAYARALLRMCFAEGEPPRTDRQWSALAGSAGLAPGAIERGKTSQAVAERRQQNLAAALAAGAFGVPSFVTEDGELFWGQDRMVHLRHHLLARRSAPG
jgi:2-hydroxychromene-2-carboxylate isomerase